MSLSLDTIQDHCRLCQQNPATVIVIDNEEFIRKVFECTKVKIKQDQMQLFPKAVCTACQLSIEEMHNFVKHVRLVDRQLHGYFHDTEKSQIARSKKFCIKLKKQENGHRFKCLECSKSYSRYRNLQIHKHSHVGGIAKITIKENLFDKCQVNENTNATINNELCKNDQEDICTDDKAELKTLIEKGMADVKVELEDVDIKPELPDQDEEIHVNKEKRKNVYPCTFSNCTKVCTSSYTLRTHLMKHEGKTPFLCVTCGKGFRTKNSLNCHEKIHATVKPYVCHECNISFSVSSNLRAHQRKHHEGIKYYCSQCPLAYISKCSLERHELVHTGIKEFKCETCIAAFYTSKELIKHQRYHQGLRLYKCEQCFKTFFEKHHLTIHIRGHTGERPYVCKIAGCGKSFIESQKLTRHLKARHTLL